MVLEVQNVSKTYPRPEGAVAALRDVSLSVAAGEFVGIRGPSGCGKTTLLLAAGTLLRPDSGRILIEGRDPAGLVADAQAGLRAAKIGFVFQQFHLVPYLTVLENVLAASLGRPSKDARPRAVDLIRQVGLVDRAGHLPSELSTGERQRTALARAMLNRPVLLLADEPTGNLDDANARMVMESLARFAGEGAAVLLVTHDANAAAFTRRTLRMSAGGCANDP